MRFVGIDSAYRNTGVVILNSAGILVDRHHLKNKEINDPKGFASWMITAMNIIQPGDVVALEGLSFGSIGRGHVLAGTYAIWQMVSISCCHSLFVVPPLRVKKWAVNNTKATKAQLINWAKQCCNDTTKWSEHEADAYALAEIAYYATKKMTHPDWPKLDDFRESILFNKKEDGVTQAENKFYFRGPNGEERSDDS